MDTHLTYEYVVENIFENPPKYMYTSYYGKEFLVTYRRVRQEVISRLMKKLSDQEKAKIDFRTKINYEEMKKCLIYLSVSKSINIYNLKGLFHDLRYKETIDSNHILWTLLFATLEGENSFDGDIRYWIEKFAHKYEVSRRICSSYSSNFKKNNKDFGDILNYALFSLVCILFYYKINNLKYLNSALKLNDFLCSVEHMIDKKDGIILATYALRKELEAVEELCELNKIEI